MIYNETQYNKHWTTTKLRSLGDFSRGKSKYRPRNDKRLFIGGGYPLVQTGDIKSAELYIKQHDQEYNNFGLAQSKLWPTGTLCITIAANIAETGILTYPMCFPDSVVGFTAHKGKSTELFMHYIFAFIRNSIKKSIAGSIQDNINIDYLENLDFKIPNISIQEKITNVLFFIDNKIEINHAINTELEKLAKTLYNYWFVQFDFPNAKDKPYRASGGEMEYSEVLKREIPKGWEVEQLGDIYNVSKGSLITEKETTIGNIKVVAAGITFSYFHSEANRPENTITISASGANAGYVNFWREKIFASDCITVRGDDDLDSYLIYLFLDFLQNTILKKATGSAQPHVYPDDIKQLYLCKIPQSKKEEIRNILIPINEKIANIQKESAELIELRDFLLPLLMNGQVRVGD